MGTAQAFEPPSRQGAKEQADGAAWRPYQINLIVRQRYHPKKLFHRLVRPAVLNYAAPRERKVESLVAAGFRGAVRSVANSRFTAIEFQRGIRVRVLCGRLFFKTIRVVAAAFGFGGDGHRPEFLLFVARHRSLGFGKPEKFIF